MSFVEKLGTTIDKLRFLDIPIEKREMEHDSDSESFVDGGYFSKENWSEKKETDLRAWFEEFDTPEDDDDWVEPGHHRMETLAWYQPISFYADFAGIFLSSKGIVRYAKRIANQIHKRSSAPHDIMRISMAGAIQSLLNHESFHHNLEWHAFKMIAQKYVGHDA
jgi:hypothetical protein